MTHLLRFVDRLLRSATLHRRSHVHEGAGTGLAIVVIGGAAYGAVMGCFGGFGSERSLQIIFSAVKVPLLFAVTTVLAMPSFFILNSLLGLRDDFAEAVRAVVVTQSAVAIVLASLAPYTALWYASTIDYNEAFVFNALMFAVASASAQWVLRRRYAPLIARNPLHHVMLWGWLVVYAFVGIQMGWVLRPFIGQPGLAPTFFRDGAWGNAYVVVLESMWRVLR
ncbi:ABC-type transport system protein OS=Hyalangium minutum GN=DB31_5780 PE=4 SV=1 [Gemmata massiliana]|uniref:ABC-type transport system protein n=1 Tax=Gemmata massiliana TaxID=1210884 RepID=A0A6P2D2R5_9BACT|nr:ABC-type transport system protein OS=Hyalangium minutum GN=DB31_5780 PE=4 SV=1 [Gemmata massiliana]